MAMVLFRLIAESARTIKMLRPRYVLIAVTLCAVALAVTGCGGETHHIASKHRPKHMVLVHASLALGAFRRFVLRPARADELSSHGSRAVDRGAAAARFASCELTIAATTRGKASDCGSCLGLSRSLPTRSAHSVTHFPGTPRSRRLRRSTPFSAASPRRRRPTASGSSRRPRIGSRPPADHGPRHP